MRRRTYLTSIAGSGIIGVSGCLSVSSDPGQDTGDNGNDIEQSGSSVTVNDAKMDLEKYGDHEQALEDGYENLEHCSDGYGIPFVNTDRTGLSWNNPRVLLYERSDSSEYELLGVEWFLSQQEVDKRPALFGGDDKQSFHKPTDGHYPGQPRHYGLHGWLFVDNPDGQFALTNPNTTCPKETES
jgi:hypothetical protein